MSSSRRKQPPRAWEWWDQLRSKRIKDDELIGRWMQRRKAKLKGFSDEWEFDMPQTEQDNSEFAIRVVHDVIAALIRNHEFMGYQLSHANGCMDDEQLEEVAKEYLAERTYTDDDLHDRLVVLKQLVGELDPEVTATMLVMASPARPKPLNRPLPRWSRRSCGIVAATMATSWPSTQHQKQLSSQTKKQIILTVKNPLHPAHVKL